MFRVTARQLRFAAPLAFGGAGLAVEHKKHSESGRRSIFKPSAPPAVECQGWFGSKPKGPYTVTYFDIPALGEAIRIVCVLGTLDFVDKRPTFAEWGQMKANSKWGQLPMMTTPEGKEMAQTKSMLRYLGKIVSVDGKKLYPSDPIVAFDVDEIIDSFEDFRMLFVPSMKMKTEDEKKEARAAIMAPGGPGDVLLKKIDAAAASSKHLVGDSLTIADVWCFMFLNFMRCGFWDYIDTDFVRKYPKLDSIQKSVKSQPLIKEYYSKVDLTQKASYKFFVEP